jgi:outer membrane protein
MRKLLTIFFLLALSTYAFGQDSVKIGFIDMQRAINEADAGKKAKAELEGMIKERQVKIDEKMALRDKLVAELEKQAVVLSEEALRQKQDELDLLTREIERMATDARMELEKSQRELELDIVKDLDDIITQIGKEGGYMLILPADVILFSIEGIEITDLVIEELDKRFKSKSKAGSRKR